MKAMLPDDTLVSSPPVESTDSLTVTLADGTTRNLEAMSQSELIDLQWREERAYAKRILDAPKGSLQRREAVRSAYDSVTKIFAAVQGLSDRPLVMGLHPRYEKLLLDLLTRQKKRGLSPSFFEIGYASGTLLKRVSQWGFPTAGIEVSDVMRRQARRLLGPDSPVDLQLGEFLESDLAKLENRYSLIYWNDVFEHVPPDEIGDYLSQIHRLLVPGGQLVTITPNWHMRPWDVTRAVCPPRTEAAGLHLKEHTLREVSKLLREAGFAKLATPLVTMPWKMYFLGSGLRWAKCLFEPGLELLPPRAVHLLCRGLGLCDTIATKGGSSAGGVARSARQPTAVRLSPEVVDDLRCPVCRSRLRTVGDDFHCADDACGQRFPSMDGVPILINEERSLFTINGFLNQEATFFKPTGRVRSWLSARTPTLSHNLAAKRVLKQMHLKLLERSDKPRVLVVGGGAVGAGMEVLLEDKAVEVVESDAAVRPHVRCICDGHDLPFADESFDGLVIQAVLEHVLDPARCVNEIHRVLKPQGLVYADTPFICQVHGRQYDFTRYTRLGHRRLFRRFRELSSGVSSGPGMALGWTTRYFLLSFFSNPRLRALVSGCSRMTLFWLKYLDYFALTRPSALDAAFAFYFLGQKSDQVFSDHELIQSYRGGF